MKLHIYSIKAQKFLFLQIEVWSMRILISNWLAEYTWSMLWRRCLLNDHSGWQKLCEGMNGLRQKIWTRKKILSPNKRDMTHSQMLGKFEYTRGPIFKVVLECLKRCSEPFLIYIYGIQCDFMPKSCWKHSIAKFAM